MKLTNKVGYSAVAAAVSLACGAGYAATISGPAATFSAEGNATATATARYDAAITAVLAADYIANDTVSLTLSNGEFQLSTATNAVATNNVTCTGPNGSMVLGFLSRSATTANYRVTGTTNTQVGATCSFTAPVLSRSMGTASAVTTLAWSANTAQSQIAFDVAAAPATIGTARTQFTSPSTVTTLNGIVDVDSGRYQFTTDDGSVFGGSEDSLSFTTQNRSGDTGAATLTSIVAVINGDFSFLDNNGTAGCQSGDLTSGHGRASATGGTLSVNTACSQLTYTQTTAGAAAITLGANVTGSNITNGSVFTAPQSFSVSPLVYTYAGASGGSTGSSSVNFSSTGSAGAWALNGASVKIGYMPYGAGISRIVYLTNRSTQSGAIEVTAINDKGVACTTFSGGTSTAGSVTNLSAALDAGVAACYGADFVGKVAFDITANVPANRAEVYSAYNVSGDRVAVINDSNGK